MLEINLLPGGKRKKAASAGSSLDFPALLAAINARMGDKVLIACVTVMVISLGAGAYLYYRQTNDRSVAEARLTKALEDSARYAKVVIARNIAEAKRDTLLRQVNLIRAIDDDRFIWPHVMDEMSAALPAYTWVTIMSFGGTPQGSANVVASPPPPPRAKGAAAADSAAALTRLPKKPPALNTGIPRDQVLIRVTGRTVDIQAMTRFMSNLEASPFFANVYNEGATPSNEASSTYYQFQLTMSYTRPDSGAVRRVPLTAAGR